MTYKFRFPAVAFGSLSFFVGVGLCSPCTDPGSIKKYRKPDQAVLNMWFSTTSSPPIPPIQEIQHIGRLPRTGGETRFS